MNVKRWVGGGGVLLVGGDYWNGFEFWIGVGYYWVNG